MELLTISISFKISRHSVRCLILDEDQRFGGHIEFQSLILRRSIRSKNDFVLTVTDLGDFEMIEGVKLPGNGLPLYVNHG